VLSSPRAIATECVPSWVVATVVSVGSESCRTTPFVETLILALPPDAFADDESDSDGLAYAAHGAAANPAPMPKATANAPTRPMYFPLPIAFCFHSLGLVPTCRSASLTLSASS
jgi:hypothetical protein